MNALAEQIAELDQAQIYGRVVGGRGLMVEAAGPRRSGFTSRWKAFLRRPRANATTIPNGYRRLEEIVGLLETEN